MKNASLLSSRPATRRFARFAAASLALVALASTVQAAWETLIDSTSFANYANFEAKWNYLYPWGSDHNGSARMYGSRTDHNHIFLSSGGILTLRAARITWNEGSAGSIPIRYHSGAIHAKQQVLVNDQFPNYELRGDFQAPAFRGAWPAFWLTGAVTWPPESDILEFKGDARNWFNTFRTPSDVSSTIVPVSSPSSWHNYRVWITKVNATEVDIHYYLDGTWKGAHRAAFVGKPMWIIINLQMEGSSGSPGPTADTLYNVRNIYVGRTRN